MDEQVPLRSNQNNLANLETTAENETKSPILKYAIFAIVSIAVVLFIGLLIFMLIPHKSTVQVIPNNQIIKEATREIKILLHELRRPINFDHAYWKQCVYNISHYITQIHEARTIDHLSNSYVQDIVLDSVEVFNNLIERTQKWYFLNRKEKEHFSAIIIESIQKLGFMFNSHEMSGELIEFKNIRLETFEVNVTVNEELYFLFPSRENNDNNNLFFWQNYFRVLFKEGSIQNGTKAVISAFLLRNTKPTLSFASKLINSDIILVVVESYQNQINPNSIRIKYRFKLDHYSFHEEMIKDFKTMCASLDSNKWSTKHCYLERCMDQGCFGYNEQQCVCDHLSAAYSAIDVPNFQNPIASIEKLKEQFLNETEISQSNWIEALSKVNNLVSKIVESLKVNYTTNHAAVVVTNVSIEILSQLIDQNQVYKDMSHQDKMRSTSLILNTVEDLSVLMASNLSRAYGDDATNINVTLEHGNVILQSKLVNVEKNESFEFAFEHFDLNIPFEGLNHLIKYEVASTVVVMQKLSSYLDYDNLQVNSPIFSIMIGKQRQTIQLNEGHKLKFSMKNVNRLQFGDEPQCTFWNFPNKNWSNKGCLYNRAQSNRTYSTCECDHLTNFAVLVDITNQEMHSVTKTILTFVCSGMTIAFTVGALYLLLKWNIKTKHSNSQNSGKMGSNRSHLIMWIAIWLIVSHIFVMIFLDQRFYESELLCGLTSIVVLFSLLTTFAFMLMLSIHLCLSTTKTSHIFVTINLGKYVLYAYLFSFFVVIFSLFFIYYHEFTVKCDGIAFWNVQKWYNTISSMKGEYFCWISSNEYPSHIYIFIIPMSLVVFVNFVLLIQVLRVVYKNSGKTLKQRQLIKLVVTASLLFNVGIPWLTYLFYINQWFRGSFYSYLFIIMNGTQGIWIFAEQYYRYWAYQRIEQSKQTVTTPREQAGLTKQTNIVTSNLSINSQKSH